jgi:hypothetical protein
MNSRTFTWLLLQDRLNTCDMLQIRQWKVTENTLCIMCPLKAHEDRIHLISECNFTSRVWNYLQIQWRGNGANDLYQVLNLGCT